jgi:hypothetical protein
MIGQIKDEIRRDIVREIVDENYGPGASYGGDPDRNLEPWLITEADRHYGASYLVDHSFPWRIVMNVLQDIVNNYEKLSLQFRPHPAFLAGTS